MQRNAYSQNRLTSHAPQPQENTIYHQVITTITPLNFKPLLLSEFDSMKQQNFVGFGNGSLLI